MHEAKALKVAVQNFVEKFKHQNQSRDKLKFFLQTALDNDEVKMSAQTLCVATLDSNTQVGVQSIFVDRVSVSVSGGAKFQQGRAISRTTFSEKLSKCRGVCF